MLFTNQIERIVSNPIPTVQVVNWMENFFKIYGRSLSEFENICSVEWT